MQAPSVVQEMKDAYLKDERLNVRMMEILSHLAAHPTASIPAARGGYAETAAAYRFFDNDKVSFENILQPHIDSTHRRMAEHPVVILAQDTTEIDVTRPEQQVEERRFEHIDRLERCLAVYLIVIWRTLLICRLGREFPDIRCEAVFEPAEWKSVYYVTHKTPPPSTPPTLQEMVRMVAQLVVTSTAHDPMSPARKRSGWVSNAHTILPIAGSHSAPKAEINRYLCRTTRVATPG
jgi:hypothetical protein